MEISDNRLYLSLVAVLGFSIISMVVVVPGYATTMPPEEEDPFAAPEEDPFAAPEEDPLGPPAEDPTSECLIATAAFGSELTPQVQFLRDFRDGHIMSTSTGASFMTAFNAWYYSFSPQVADYERDQPWLQQTVKASIYPLLGILNVAEKGYSIADGEGGAVLAGFAASSLIGMVYLSPAAVALRNKTNIKKIAIPVAIAVVASLGMISAGIAAQNGTILTYSTSLFVISSIGIGLLAVVYLARLIDRKLNLQENTGSQSQ